MWIGCVVSFMSLSRYRSVSGAASTSIGYRVRRVKRNRGKFRGVSDPPRLALAIWVS
jgi:hypothetical protein